MPDQHRRDLIRYIRSLSSELSPQETGVRPRLKTTDGTGEIKCVLFDVYGTLLISGSGDISLVSDLDDEKTLTAALKDIDAEGDLDESGRKGVALLRNKISLEHEEAKQHGVQYPEIEIRKTWQDITEELTEQRLLTNALDAHAIEKLATGFECRVNPVWPMPGLENLLAILSSRNIPCGIVSNAQFFTPLMFEAFLERPLSELGIDPELSTWSFELRRAKPDVALFRNSLTNLAGKHEIKPGQTLYLGNDMLNDVIGAQKAGCQTALFAGDKRSLRLREDHVACREITPDYLVTDLSQLVDICGITISENPH